MRIQWKRVCILSLLAGLLLLTVRGCIIANRDTDNADSDAPAPTENKSDLAVTVFDHREEALLTLPLETYLVHVVAAEMPASFPSEALKAQSVAARTYTVYHMLHGGCRRHDAHVCTDSACCQAYTSETRLMENWGGNYGTNLAKVSDAVAATAYEVLLYDGAPIEALYHSASGGRTESASDAYGNDVPYLQSVMSTAETGTRRIATQKTFSTDEFCRLVNEKWPDARLKPASLARRLSVTQTSGSGRVLSMQLGSQTVTGRQLRSLLSLDSTLFTYTVAGSSITFDVRGYGHGVGMSQTGANAMALGGRNYREILTYYYTDVEIGRIKPEAFG